MSITAMKTALNALESISERERNEAITAIQEQLK